MSGTHIRLAALIVIAGTLAGCGTVRNTPPAADTTRPANHAVPGPPAGSRAQAVRLAWHMLAGAVLPRGSRPYSGPLTLLQRQAIISLGSGPESADVNMLWQVPVAMEQTAAFLRDHVPAGMRVSYATHQSDAGFPTGEVEDLSPRSLPAGIQQADLKFQIAPGVRGGCVVRGDGQVTWYPSRSAAERVSAETPAVIVTAQFLNPRPHTVTRTVTDPAIIARLAHLLNGMHAAPQVAMSCPAELVLYRVTFTARGPALTASTGGCLSVAVTAQGKGQPALWDGDNSFAKAVSALVANRG